MKRNRVNVLTVINSASNITTEIIDGREHIVVRGVVPIVDDIVMNRRFYPAAEIKKSYNTLERNPMPLDHPKIDGKNVSASDPRAVNNYHVGAWFQNVTHADGRVTGDMYVDRRFAENSEKGKRLVERLDNMAAGKNVEPIHISTGLGFRSIATNGESKGKRYREICTDMQFDHVAILLDKPGAGTPAEGVGIFVNADGSESEIEVANLSDAADCTREGLKNKARFFFTNASKYSFDDISKALAEKLREGRSDDYWAYPETVWPDEFIYRDENRYFKQKYLIDDDGKAVFVGTPVEVSRKPTEYEEVKNNEDEFQMKTTIVNALKAAGKTVDGLSDEQLFQAYNSQLEEAAKKKKDDAEKRAKEEEDKKKKGATNSEEMPEWFKPFATQLESIATNSKKDTDNKRAAVKAKFGLSDIAVNAMDGAILDEMYAQTVTAAPINSGFQFNTNNQDDQWKGYDLNKIAEEEK
ncbi:DUF2213 domain-containing protein [Salmonella enterica]|nr:DUF2213 domain-containing protein [Salmonella enterica]EAT7574340.1 DUF2213 domain-containing protein [Salmonella enterica]